MYSSKGFNQVLSVECLIQAKRKTPEALKHLYKCYANACYTTAYRLSGNASLATDITHDAFLVIFEKLNTFVGSPEQFGGWLKRIVVNKTINRLKFDMRFVEEEQVSDRQSPLFNSQWLDVSLDLERLLEQLSKQQRTVLWLYEVEGYSHSEIATMFDKSVSFSKVTLLRAYRSLRILAEATHE